MSHRITGLIAAPFTPFDEQGELVLDAIGPYARFLSEQGLAGAFVAGTTGEGMSMTTEERQRLLEAWTGASPEGFHVIAHVGHTCLGDCRHLAAHAQRSGAAGIGVMGPCFFRPATVEALVDWCAAVADAAPSLPFYYYHMPVMSGVNLPIEPFFEQARRRIPTMAGIKYTHEDLDEYARLLAAADGQYDIFFGRDQLLLTGLQAGAVAAVGSTYSFAAPLYLDLISAWRGAEMDRAAGLQQIACDIIRACQSTGAAELAGLKAVMNLAGLPVGPVRPPLTELTDEQRSRLREEVEPLLAAGGCTTSTSQE